MARPKSAVPRYCLHRATGRAFVTIEGVQIYLGRHGSPESRDAYTRAVGEWLACGRHAPVAADDLSVAELLVRFLGHAERYYAKENQETTSEVSAFKAAIKEVRLLYGPTPVRTFGPLALKAVRDAMIRKGWSRGYVNSQVGRIKRVWRWAAENELVKAPAWHGLQAVAGLRRGRSEARENPPVRPVPEHVVEETIKHLTPTLAAMVRVQALTGMRAGELTAMRAADISMSGPTWLYRPPAHKMAYLGRPRVVPIGPRAQELLGPYLKADPAAYLFSPRQSERERYDGCTVHRRPDQKPNERKTDRQLGERYDSRSYHAAIRTACAKAFPEPKGLSPEERRDWRKANWWHPHQLRHSAASRVRQQYGLEQVQSVLGHANAKVSELYAESDIRQAVLVMQEIG